MEKVEAGEVRKIPGANKKIRALGAGWKEEESLDKNESLKEKNTAMEMDKGGGSAQECE